MDYISGIFSPAGPRRVGFEDVLALQKAPSAVIISTLPADKQSCLIKGTVECGDEETKINAIVAARKMTQTPVLIYGENACDTSPNVKYNQLRMLGFVDVRIFVGGLFEYLLLQDIYGMAAFPTRGEEPDMLCRRPKLAIV